MPSATAYVTSTDSCSRSSLRSGRMNASCSATPSAKATGVMIRIEMNGSIPGPVKRFAVPEHLERPEKPEAHGGRRRRRHGRSICLSQSQFQGSRRTVMRR